MPPPQSKHSVTWEAKAPKGEEAQYAHDHAVSVTERVLNDFARDPMFAALRQDTADIPIVVTNDIPQGASGAFYRNKDGSRGKEEIRIKPGANYGQVYQTLVHELVHADRHKAGLSETTNNRTTLDRSIPKEKALADDLAAKGRDYGPDELRAWILQSSMPGAQKVSQSYPNSEYEAYLRSTLDKHSDAVKGFIGRSSQLQRPVTNHPTEVPAAVRATALLNSIKRNLGF